MEMIEVKVPNIAVKVESRGITVPVELGKVPVELLQQLVLHGVKQKVADAASGAAMEAWRDIKGESAPKPSRDQMRDFVEGAGRAKTAEYTQAAMEKAAQALYDGKWQVREAGGTSSRLNDVDAIAHEMAKAALQAVFAKAVQASGKKATFANFVTISPAIAKYFREGGARPVWNETEVAAYIAKQREAGGPDYAKLAQEELARREALVAQVDLGDLLGDI